MIDEQDKEFWIDMNWTVDPVYICICSGDSEHE